MMQSSLFVIVLAIVIAAGYGVVFSLVYPLVPPDAALIALFALLGVLTALSISGVWKTVTKQKAVLASPASGIAAFKSEVDERFDAFLCHSNLDKPAVRLLNETLRSGNIKTWLDEKEIQPGEIWQEKLEATISCISACLVVVGDSGFGPWQDVERRAFINEFANRGCKIIPVLIGKPDTVPELPLFLKQFMWSDLRNNDGHQLARLISALRSCADSSSGTRQI